MSFLLGSSLSFAEGIENKTDSTGPYAEIIKVTTEKQAKPKEKKDLLKGDYYVPPKTRVKPTPQDKGLSDTKPDRITHREVTAANTRRGDGLAERKDMTSPHDGGVPLHQKVIDSARGPNSMAESIRNNPYLNGSKGKK